MPRERQHYDNTKMQCCAEGSGKINVRESKQKEWQKWRILHHITWQNATTKASNCSLAVKHSAV